MYQTKILTIKLMQDVEIPLLIVFGTFAGVVSGIYILKFKAGPRIASYCDRHVRIRPNPVDNHRELLVRRSGMTFPQRTHHAQQLIRSDINYSFHFL